MAKTAAWKRSPLATEDYNSVAVSADGSRTVAGTFFYNGNTTPLTRQIGMIAWNADGHRRWKDEFDCTAPGKDAQGRGGQGGVYAVAISGDGAWAASGGLVTPTLGFINAYDVETGSKSLVYYPSTLVKSIALNDNGSCLAAGGEVVSVFARVMPSVAWSLPLRTTPVTSDPEERVERLAMSANGEWIAAAVSGGYVRLIHNQMASGAGIVTPAPWQVNTGPLNRRYAQAVAFAADGSGFAVGAANGSVYYFDINAYKTSGVLAPAWAFDLPNSGSCKWVAVSANGSKVAAIASSNAPGAPAGQGNVFLLSNNGTSATQAWATVPFTADGPNTVSIDSAAQYVAVADGTPNESRGGFYLFDGTDGTLRWKYPTADMNYPIALSAGASVAVGGSDDGSVYYFSVP